MKCNLWLQSWYDDENTSTSGTIDLDGQTITIDITGSASERGYSGTVNGQEVASNNQDDKEITTKLDGPLVAVYELCWNVLNRLEVPNREDGWRAHILNGQVVTLIADNNVIIGVINDDCREDARNTIK